MYSTSGSHKGKCMALFTASIQKYALAIYLSYKAKCMSISSGSLEPLKQSSGPGLDNNPDIFLQEKIQAYSGEKRKILTVTPSSNHQIAVLCQLRSWEVSSKMV